MPGRPLASFYDTNIYDYEQYVDPTRPDPEQYLDDPTGYDTAMNAWVTDRNGGPAFAAPTSTPYQRDDGSMGEWRTAGTNREESTGEYWANYLNNMWFRSEQGLDMVGLMSWIGLHPEHAQAALMAVGPDGAPLLDHGLINFMTGDGNVSMPPREAPPAPGSGDPNRPGGAGAPPVQTGFVDTQKGYWQNAAGHSAYLDPATGQWTYHVLGQDGQTWTPMTPDEYQAWWTNSPYGGGTGPGSVGQPVAPNYPGPTGPGGPGGPVQPGMTPGRIGSAPVDPNDPRLTPGHVGSVPQYGFGQAAKPVARLPQTGDPNIQAALDNWFQRRRRSKMSPQAPNDGRGY